MPAAATTRPAVAAKSATAAATKPAAGGADASHAGARRAQPAAEPESPSAGAPFVDACVERAVLAQPSALAAAARPAPPAEKKGGAAKGKKGAKKEKKEAKVVLSSWAETFLEAMRVRRDLSSLRDHLSELIYSSSRASSHRLP
jgi:hypothetical protein